MSTAVADPGIEARTLINRDYISYSAISTYQNYDFLKLFFVDLVSTITLHGSILKVLR